MRHGEKRIVRDGKNFKVQVRCVTYWLGRSPSETFVWVDTGTKLGFLRNKGSMWIGVHYSAFNKRWCINLIPCFTFWITKPGGKTP